MRAGIGGDTAVKVGAVIQARMNSSRFPGKTLHRVEGQPLLDYLVEGLRRSRTLDEIVVATSHEATDNPIEAYCAKKKLAVFRGSLNDVAGRMRDAANDQALDAMVRISGDSPLLDYRLVDQAVDLYRHRRCHLVTNVMPRTFPKGQSVEVINVERFNEVCSRMILQDEKEHVTLYYYRNPDAFSIRTVLSEDDDSSFQLSVDTPEDMRRFQRILSQIDGPHWEFGYKDFIRLARSANCDHNEK